MTNKTPLMPKATAVWLVAETALSFEQISEFCGLHLLEVKGIADGEVAQGIRGKDPITAGELTREEIKLAEANPNHRLRLAVSKVEIPQVKTKRGPRYTPLSRRHDRPNAVLWLLKHHPELRDSQIIRLVGTTKPTIQQIRDRTHWNSAALSAQDPVTLGLCTQVDLDDEVKIAAKRHEKERIAAGIPAEQAGTLLPTADTTHYMPGDPQPDVEEPKERPQDEEARMLERLKQMTSKRREEDEDQPDIDMSALTATSEPPEQEQEPAQADAPRDKPKQDYLADVNRFAPGADADAVAAIVKHLGIALRNTDASLVSCSSKEELTRVRESWLRKKLALEDDDETLDAAISSVCETMKAEHRKHRVTFYYLLAAHVGKLEALTA